MKLFKVQSLKSKVQSNGGRSRMFKDFGRWTLDFGLRPSRLGGRDGVALVITLIMLSIITFMAVTFLVLSQRERNSVSTAMDQKIARQAADTAFERVSADLLTRMLVRTNFQDMDLLVSTNYINYAGLRGGSPGSLSPTNVNYDYLSGGAFAPLTSQDQDINIASLLYDPRVPVYVKTNNGGPADFRFYLDLNRNGRFDKTGKWPVIVNNGGTPSYVSTNGTFVPMNLPVPAGTYLLTNDLVGDPQWIGILARPLQLHSANNQFLSRYAYVVIPVGNTLDVNTMHNQAITKSLTPGNDGYFRNQGIGPWEFNLAAFLVDLNTNIWDAKPAIPANYYQYNRGDVTLSVPTPNRGLAFDDAFSLLSYRYDNTYASLKAANALFPFPVILTSDNIDQYSDGPLMTGTTNIVESGFADGVAFPWPGAKNTNHYFSQQDFFNVSKTGAGFSARLQQAGTSNDTYNAYTFYRLLSQLGTDSAGDQGKLNVNYKNTDNRGTVLLGAETNMVGWTALDFFTNAAAAMFKQMDLRDMNGNLVTVTNIPIYADPTLFPNIPANQSYYTPAVHRVLQLAANMCDATVTNRFINGGPTNYPSVFRPIFSSDNGIVYVSGYVEVNDVSAQNPAFFPMLERTNVVKTKQINNSTANIYGLPWVIGAKKGFPSFNEFSMDNPLEVSRKLEFTNGVTRRPPWTTNQIFDVSITNTFGFEAWNPYTNSYNRPVSVTVSNELSIQVYNENGFPLLNVQNLPYGTNIIYNPWPGWNQQETDGASIKLPMGTASANFADGIYEKNSPQFIPLNPASWGSTFVPHLWMSLQCKVRFVAIDTQANRIIDFVNIDSTQPLVDVSGKLNNNATGHFVDLGDDDGEWDTNLLHGIEVGILNQIEVSKGGGNSVWPNSDPLKVTQSRFFNHALLNGGTNHFQAPYTPHRTIHQHISWQANDPLVHYMQADITSTNGILASYNTVDLLGLNPPLPNLGKINNAYQPWGGRHLPHGTPLNNSPFDLDLRVKDTMVEQADNWDFPTNRIPNIGWLGRIHRGTPWQTVYMKPSSLTPSDWIKWGNDNVFLTNGNNVTVDSPNSRPTMDYGLFDIFTSSVNPNAAVGRLNVNQTNMAAWSAALAGVNVLSNGPSGVISMPIPPAGVYDPANPPSVAAIVNSINAVRAGTNAFNNTIFLNHAFQHAGDVLSAPALTVTSPFLNTTGITNTLSANGINDEMLERIPQQIMSLLTLNQTPRFVIYSFGQTLHPAADHPLVTGGTFNGLCTNYQITAESATRAVVRVEGTADPKFVNGKVDSLGRSYPPHLVVEEFNVLGPD